MPLQYTGMWPFQGRAPDTATRHPGNNDTERPAVFEIDEVDEFGIDDLDTNTERPAVFEIDEVDEFGIDDRDTNTERPAAFMIDEVDEFGIDDLDTNTLQEDPTNANAKVDAAHSNTRPKEPTGRKNAGIRMHARRTSPANANVRTTKTRTAKSEASRLNPDALCAALHAMRRQETANRLRATWEARNPVSMSTGDENLPATVPLADQRDVDRATASIVGATATGLNPRNRFADFDCLVEIHGACTPMLALIDSGSKLTFINSRRKPVADNAGLTSTTLNLTGLSSTRRVIAHNIPSIGISAPGDGPHITTLNVLAFDSSLPYDLVLGEDWIVQNRVHWVYSKNKNDAPVDGVTFEDQHGTWRHDAPLPDIDQSNIFSGAAAVTHAMNDFDVISTKELALEDGAEETPTLQVYWTPNTVHVGAIAKTSDDDPENSPETNPRPFALRDDQLPEDAERRAEMEVLLQPFIDRGVKSEDEMPRLEDTKIFRAGVFAQTIKLKEGIDPELLPNAKPYRLAPDQQLQLDRFLKFMSDKGFIQRSTSPMSSPIFLVPKKGYDIIDGVSVRKMRVVSDFRKLNALTVPDRHAAANLEQRRDRIVGFKFASTVDLRQSFFQLPLTADSRKYTAFSTSSGHWEYCCSAMGLRNSSAAFGAMAESTFGETSRHKDYCTTYCDDLVIFSATWTEHKKHLTDVLTDMFDVYGYSVHLGKSTFGRKTILFLGSVISSNEDGTTSRVPDPALTAAVREAKPPRSPKEMRAFLGLTNVFTDYIPRYALLAKSLNRMRANNLKQREYTTLWCGDDKGASSLAAFSALTLALSAPPLLLLCNSAKPYTLVTDSSQTQIGAVLMQEGHDGLLQPVGFMSKALSEHRSHWAIHEKELLAIVVGARHFRPLIGFGKFTVATDHRPLTWFLGERPQPKLSWVQARLLDACATFDMHITYLPGKDNWFADYLSRVNCTVDPDMLLPERILESTRDGRAFHDDDEFPDPLEDLTNGSRAVPCGANSIEPIDAATVRALYPLDPRTNEILKTLNDAAMTQHHYHRKYLLRDGIIFIKPNDFALSKSPVLLIPSPTKDDGAAADLKDQILALNHDLPAAGHYGAETTYATARAQYFWKGMASDAQRFCSNCPTCIMNSDKPPGSAGYYQPSQPPTPGSQPWRCVSFDFICGGLPAVPYNNRTADQLLVITCQLSGLTRLLPCSTNITAAGVAELYFDRVFPQLGLPAEIKGDRDVLWVSAFFRTLLAKLGVSLRLTSPYHSQGNGLCERKNREVVTMLRNCICKCDANWAEQCGAFEFAMNRRVTRSRDGLCPFTVAQGWTPAGPMDPLSTDLIAPTSMEGVNAATRQRIAGLRAADAITLKQDEIASAKNTNIRRSKTVVGDFVMISKNAFTAPQDRTRKGFKYNANFNGPFQVTRVSSSGNTVQVDMAGVKSKAGDAFSIQAILPCPAPEKALAERAAFEHARVDEDAHLIDKVLSYRTTGGKQKWTVSWVGYGTQHNSELEFAQFLHPPATGLDAVNPLLIAFERARQGKPFPEFDFEWQYPELQNWDCGTTRDMPDKYRVMKSPGGKESTLEHICSVHQVDMCKVKSINIKNPSWKLHPSHRNTSPSTWKSSTVINKNIIIRLGLTTALTAPQ